MDDTLTLTKSQSSNLSLKIHRSKAEIEELRPLWEAESHHPNSDLDHFLLVCTILPEVISPCVLSVWEGSECRCLVAGRIGDTQMRPRLGYFNMPRLNMRTLTIIHEGVVGPIVPAQAKVIVEGIKQLLNDKTIDLVLANIRETSILYAAIQAMEKRHFDPAKVRWFIHRELTLGVEPGFLVTAMKSKHRSWVKRKARDLDAAYNNQISWRWLSQIEDVPAVCKEMEKVAARTYQRGLAAGFKDDEEHRRRLSLFAQQGKLRVILLEAEQKPVAFWFGVVYRGVFHSEATGYVAELGEHEAGTQIFLRLVDELVREKVTRFDFGLGDAAYKERFGDNHWQESNVRIFATNFKCRLIRFYLDFNDRVDQALRNAVSKLGLVDKIKRKWRRRLATDAQKKQETAPAATEN